VRGLLRQREQVNAVYYAPAAMNPAPGGRPLEPLDVGHFVRDEEQRQPAEYALWWPTAEEPLLSGSPALAHLDAWFAALDGIGSYLFSAFVSSLQLAGEGAKEAIYALPEAAAVVAVEGPGGFPLYLSASAAEGLWFAVETSTPAARRNLFLKLLAELAARFRATVLEHGVPLRDEDLGPQLAFWRRARREALAAERAEGLRIGLVSDVGMKGRRPGASTAAQRATTTTDEGGSAPLADAPSDGLVSFADAQLEVACARITECAGQGGEEPNLHPFVAVRLPDRTERVTLSMFAEPEAYERAPRLIAERPGATLAVVACDGVVRLGSERFDAVRLRVHERGTPRSFEFFQRYRLGQRFERVGNWALCGTAEPMFPMEAAASDPGPPPAHARATLERRLADLLEWLSVGDPPGLELDRRHLPLFSPTLHTLDDGHWKQARFMMGNEAWAESSSESECASAKQAGTTVAVFETDEVLEVDGREARRFRFRVHHRGDARSWVFVQPYAMPEEGRPFATVGELALLRDAEPMLPGPALPAASPSPPEAVPSSLGPVHAADVEKRRLELTQGLKSRLQTGRLSLLTGSRRMDVEREVDLADILRFVARRLEHDAAGLTVVGLSGAPRRLVWPELSEVWARRLPPEPPWAQALIVELLPVRGAPVRILASTAINFRGLPGGAAPSRNENLRKLLVLARSEQPSLTADPATATWMDRAEAPPVLDIRQLAERDVRFP
jgi:hypothetical protein